MKKSPSTSRRKSFVRVLSICLALLAVGPTRADTLTATFSGTASGNLNGTNFNNAAFSFSETYNSAKVMQLGFAFFTPAGVAFSIAGVGTGTALALSFSDNPANGFIVVSTGGAPPALSGSNASLIGYDFKSPVGPVPLNLEYLNFSRWPHHRRNAEHHRRVWLGLWGLRNRGGARRRPGIGPGD